jgi:hypothetical protein
MFRTCFFAYLALHVPSLSYPPHTCVESSILSSCGINQYVIYPSTYIIITYIKIGTHDLNGNRRRSSTEEENMYGGEDDAFNSPTNNGKKWTSAKGAVKGTSAFAHRGAVAPNKMNKSPSSDNEKEMGGSGGGVGASFDGGSSVGASFDRSPVNASLSGGGAGVRRSSINSSTSSLTGGGGERRGSVGNMTNNSSAGGKKGRRKSVKDVKLNSVIIPNSPVRFVPKKEKKSSNQKDVGKVFPSTGPSPPSKVKTFGGRKGT